MCVLCVCCPVVRSYALAEILNKGVGGGQLLEALADPWAFSAKQGAAPDLTLVGQAGGFRGYGGQFLTPPQVITAGDRIYAYDSDCCWSVHADCEMPGYLSPSASSTSARSQS